MKKIVITAVMLLFTASSAMAFGTSKFKDEVEKEIGAVKLTREVERGGYGLITTAELTELIKSGEDVLIIDTMPYDASYKKAHVPEAEQFLFPIPDMVEWDMDETGGKSQEDYLKLLGTDKDKKIVVYDAGTCGW